MQRSFVAPRQTATSAARRARGKLEYCASSPETASAGASELAARAAAGFVLEAAPEPSHHGYAKRREASRRYDGLDMAQADLNQRGAARTRGELVCCATSPETANASASALASHAAADLVSEAAAGTSHYGHAPKMRSHPPV